MKNQKLLSLLILTLFLFTFPGFRMNGQQIKKSRDIDIVYIGNSITQGGLLKNPREEAPPAVSSEYLRGKPGVGTVNFINQGRSGFTTVDFLPSSAGTLTKVVTATQQLHKENQRLLVFSVSLGTNDSAEKGPNGSPVDPGSYQKNLKSIADQLLTDFPECKIILQQPIWYSPNTYNRSKYMAEGLARLKTYFPELRSLVKKYSKTNPGHVFRGDVKGFAYFHKNYLTDLNPETGNAGTFYLHPNKKGASVLGKLWGEAIYKRIIKH